MTLHIYFATWLEDNQGVTLTALEAEKRLMSYYFIAVRSGGPQFSLEDYVETGLVSKKGDEKE